MPTMNPARPAFPSLLSLQVLFLVVPLLTGARLARAAAPAPTSPEELMRRVEARFRAIEDYQCLADLECRLGEKSESGSYQIWFKQPQCLRVKVLRGRSRGSDVVVDEQGKISGRKGGLLKPFVIRLRPDDSRIRSLTGMPLTQFDLGKFCRRFWEQSGRPDARTQLTPARGGGDSHEVSLTYAADGARMREIYRIDPFTLSVQEAEIYRDNVRTDRVVFRDIRFNTGVRDGFFRL